MVARVVISTVPPALPEPPTQRTSWSHAPLLTTQSSAQSSGLPVETTLSQY